MGPLETGEVSHWIPSASRRAIAERYGCSRGQRVAASCSYCDAVGTVSWPTRPGSWVNFLGLQLDHIVPKARGGSDHPDNLTLACGPCNASKRDKLLSEWVAA